MSDELASELPGKLPWPIKLSHTIAQGPGFGPGDHLESSLMNPGFLILGVRGGDVKYMLDLHFI